MWDKVVLVLLVLAAFSTMIAGLLAETVIGGLGLLLMAALWGVAFAVGMWIHKRREARQWISRRAL